MKGPGRKTKHLELKGEFVFFSRHSKGPGRLLVEVLGNAFSKFWENVFRLAAGTLLTRYSVFFCMFLSCFVRLSGRGTVECGLVHPPVCPLRT